MTQIDIMVLMTEAEAREHVSAINASAADIGRRLLDIQEREGWRALGYKNWTAFLEGEFSYSRKHLYELMTAAPILESLLPTGYKISTKAAVALAQFDNELRPAILRTAKARYGELTESNVARVGNVIQQMAVTGHVDIADGSSTPIDAALDTEDIESNNRQKQYIADNSEWERLGKPVEIPAMTLASIKQLSELLSGVGTSETIQVRLYIKKAVDQSGKGA